MTARPSLLEDAIKIDTVDEVPQTPRTAEPKTPHGPKFDEGLFAATNSPT